MVGVGWLFVQAQYFHGAVHHVLGLHRSPHIIKSLFVSVLYGILPNSWAAYTVLLWFLAEHFLNFLVELLGITRFIRTLHLVLLLPALGTRLASDVFGFVLESAKHRYLSHVVCRSIKVCILLRGNGWFNYRSRLYFDGWGFLLGEDVFLQVQVASPFKHVVPYRFD